MAGETLGKLIRMFSKAEEKYERPLAFKLMQWGNLGPEASAALSARKKVLFKGYDMFSCEAEAAQQELKHLFEHTGGSMVSDDVSDVLGCLQKSFEIAQEQARQAWVSMDTALEGARNLARLVTVEDTNQDAHHG